MANETPNSGNGFKSFLSHAMPFITAALSTTGPIGTVAGSLLAKAIGTDKVPTTIAEAEAAYTSALTAANAPAELIERAKEAERQFQLQCQQMGIDSVEKILALENADRENARAREIAVRDRTPAIGFYLITAIFASMVFALYFWAPPAQNEKLLYLLLGAVVVAWPQTISYFYGTTAGSSRKTELLAQAPAIASQ
jgi:hypothetical protein